MTSRVCQKCRKDEQFIDRMHRGPLYSNYQVCMCTHGNICHRCLRGICLRNKKWSCQECHWPYKVDLDYKWIVNYSANDMLIIVFVLIFCLFRQFFSYYLPAEGFWLYQVLVGLSVCYLSLKFIRGSGFKVGFKAKGIRVRTLRSEDYEMGFTKALAPLLWTLSCRLWRLACLVFLAIALLPMGYALLLLMVNPKDICWSLFAPLNSLFQRGINLLCDWLYLLPKVIKY